MYYEDLSLEDVFNEEGIFVGSDLEVSATDCNRTEDSGVSREFQVEEKDKEEEEKESEGEN